MHYYPVAKDAPIKDAPIKHASITILTIVLAACSGSGGSGADPFRQGPEITITTPAVGGTLETPDETVTLAGTAESSASVVSVSWTNDRGGEGEASGGESWKTEAIALEIGENTITITATDSAGGTASRAVVIVREGDGTGSVTLSWTAPTTREDGTPLTDLSGYYIRYGRMSETYDLEIKIENPGVVTYVVEPLSPGTWYFVIMAYDSNGLESNPSNEIELTIN
jgi:hypothetical protein